MFQKLFKFFFYAVMFLCCISLIVSCAQSEKAPVATSAEYANINDHIIDADRKVKKAYEDQWDMLAYRELKKSADRVENAKKYYSEGEKIEKISKELREFDANYNEAQMLAEARAPKVDGLLVARKQALDSGVQKSQSENNRLYKLDHQFRSLSDNKRIAVKDFSKLQTEYIKLSAQITINKHLSVAKRQVEVSINNKARRYAPRTLNKAELDIKNAENMIGVNLNNPEEYYSFVSKANLSASVLAAVIEEQRKVNYNLDEIAAQKIVQQSKMVKQLNTDLRKKDEELYYTNAELQAYQNELGSTRDEISKKDQELSMSEQELQKREAELAKAEKERQFQLALASAQEKFSKNEADVYRQGDKILIRLKKMEFPVGAATVPEKSKQLLDKVATVAKDLSPQQVIVEGHTDSIGPAELNDRISIERADSVRDYLADEGLPLSILQSEGFGFDKPLSTNKTKAGRAQNRRVDIWITPTSVDKVTE